MEFRLADGEWCSGVERSEALCDVDTLRLRIDSRGRKCWVAFGNGQTGQLKPENRDKAPRLLKSSRAASSLCQGREDALTGRRGLVPLIFIRPHSRQTPQRSTQPKWRLAARGGDEGFRLPAKASVPMVGFSAERACVMLCPPIRSRRPSAPRRRVPVRQGLLTKR